MTCLKSLSRIESGLHSFTQLTLFFRKFSDGFFWREEHSHSICFPKGCQKTINCGTLCKGKLSEWENCIVYLNYMLPTSQPFVWSSNWPAAIDTKFGRGVCTCLKVSWCKIWKKKSKKLGNRTLGWLSDVT